MAVSKKNFEKLCGWTDDSRARIEAMERNDRHPVFCMSSSGIQESGKKQVQLLHKVVEQVVGEGKFPIHLQTIGDCVSHGFGLGVDVVKCVQIALQNAREEYRAETCTEAIYGASRVEIGKGQLGSGDGSVGAWAAESVRKLGTLPREVFELSGQTFDLRRYSGSRAKEWGMPRAGLPDLLEPAAREHCVQTTSLVQNYEEARDAIFNGYPVAVCSGQGFTKKRDSEGFANPYGSWAHCVMPDASVLGTDVTSAKDVVPGQLVYGHDGQLHRVLQKHERFYEGEVVTIRTTGVNDVVYTTDHPVLIYRPTRSSLQFRSEIPLSQAAGVTGFITEDFAASLALANSEDKFVFVAAKDILPGDYLVLPKIEYGAKIIPDWSYPDRRCTRPLPTLSGNSDEAWLFGLYIADGDTCPGHKVRWTLSLEDDIDRLKKVVRSWGYEPTIKKKGKFYRVSVYHSALSRQFKRWFGGGRVEDKKIPAWLLTWDRSAIVEGLQQGDGGSYAGKGYITTSSKTLLNQLVPLLASLGQSPIVEKQARSEGSYETDKDAWYIRWVENRKREECKHVSDFYCMPVRDVNRSDYQGSVFNYEIEDVNSFVSDSVVSHNCMLFIAVDDEYKRPGLLCMNSWGPNWISGPKRHGQPDGSFWVDAKVVTSMLRRQDSFALSSFNGFPAQKFRYSFV